MKQSAVQIKKVHQDVVVLNETNIHLQPEHVGKGWGMMKKKKGEILFPKKYYAAQKTLIRIELHQRWEQQPDAPLKDIVAGIVQNLPDFIPGNRILELTQFTIVEWQKLLEKEAVGL